VLQVSHKIIDPFFIVHLLPDINSILTALLEKKKLLESEDQSIEVEVLLDFLNATKKQKLVVSASSTSIVENEHANHSFSH
jgi:hypothetical protein